MRSLLVSGLLLCACGVAELAVEAPPAVADTTRRLSAPTGSMGTARTEFGLAVLADGRVLAAGGSGAGNTDFSSAELWDPQTGTWSPTGSMAQARRAYAEVVLPTAEVLAMGGDASAGRRAGIERFNAANGTWAPAGSQVVVRANHTATLLLDGRVLIAGGFVADISASAELYDPLTQTSVALPAMTSARARHVAVRLVDGRVLLAGGDAVGSSFCNASAELFDPATLAFTAVGPLSNGRVRATASLLPDGRVLVAGGAACTGYESMRTADVFDPATASFSATGLMSAGRWGHAAVALPDGVLVLGGGGATGNLASVERWSLQTGVWSTEDPLLVGRDGFAAAAVNGKVLVAGGYGTTWLTSAELYERSGSCVPTTCQAAGAACGSVSDGCGATLSCGNDCGPSGQCVNNQCVCQPAVCPGTVCGQYPDGCGGTISCTCGAGLMCPPGMGTCVLAAGPVIASWDAVLKAPGCGVGTSCDTGSLVNGRAQLGPETHAPNTLGTCADGTAGSYHSDESIDRLKISTLDGTILAGGKQVRVDATVWAWGTGDVLDVYSAPNANSPVWALAGTVATTGHGVRTLSITFTLPAGSLQAVRAQFRYYGTQTPCASGVFNDRDDLVFAAP